MLKYTKVKNIPSCSVLIRHCIIGQLLYKCLAPPRPQPEKLVPYIPRMSLVAIGFCAEVGNVSSKCNGVRSYRLCLVLRAIIFSSDKGSNLEKALNLRRDNDSQVRIAITFGSKNFSLRGEVSFYNSKCNIALSLQHQVPTSFDAVLKYCMLHVITVQRSLQKN